MRAKHGLLFVGLVIWVLFPMSASAFSIAETTDFGTTNSSTTNLGNFDIGLNTVSGSVARVNNGGDYADFWDATLLDGLQITGIKIMISDHNNSGFFVGAAAGGYVGGNGPFIAQAYTDLSSNGTYSLGATLGTSYPFDAGQYYFGAATNVRSDTSYDYEWRVTVASVGSGSGPAPVPEPSTILLLGGGLAGLAFYRRKRK